MNASGSPSLAARVMPALVSAALVAAIIFVQQIIGFLFGNLPWQVAGGSSQAAASGLQALGASLITYTLPFAIGVFASLWLLAPVRAGMRLWPLVGRGLLASLAGAVAVLIVNVLTGLASHGLIDFFWSLVAQIFGCVSTAVNEAPIVILVLVVQHLVRRR
jgi:hypothetical protein